MEPEKMTFLNDCGVSTSSCNVNMQCASFATRLMSKHKLPETSVNDIMESTKIFLVFSAEINTRNLQLKVSEALAGFKARKTHENLLQKKLQLHMTTRSYFRTVHCAEKRYVTMCG